MPITLIDIIRESIESIAKIILKGSKIGMMISLIVLLRSPYSSFQFKLFQAFTI